MNRIVSISVAATVLLGITGCDQSSSNQVSQIDTQQAEEPQAPAWVLTEEPTGALSIVQARAEMQEGDQVVIRGRIGSRKSPMSSDSPVFTMVDLGIEYCGQTVPKGCKTPWDYCCESQETISNNSATVEMVEGGEINLIAEG